MCAKDGKRLNRSAPFGHRVSQTFVAGLAHDRLIAPWVLEGAMNRAAFETDIEHVLAPTLSKGDVVILDNLAVHKSARAAAVLKEHGRMGPVPAALLA